MMLAASIRATLHQRVIIEPFDSSQGVEGYDTMGQPMYGPPHEARCRISPSMTRTVDARGDTHSAAGTSLIFAADEPITDRDRISLPDLPDRAPIIAQVVVHYDLRGQPTHREVRL